MSDTLFTLPGKLGDNLARLKVAHRWARENRTKVDLCLDPGSRPLEGLLREQDWVDRVLYAEVDNYKFGGQPFDFGRDAEFRARYRNVWHLGFRMGRPIRGHFTHEALERSGCPVRREGLLDEPCLRLERGPVPLDLMVHLDVSKPKARAEALATLAPVYGKIAASFRTIYFAGTDLGSPFYAPFRGSNTVFLDSRDGFDVLLPPLAASTVFCVDSAVRWLAFACGVPRVVLRHRGNRGFAGERPAGETVLQPYDSAGLLRSLGLGGEPLLGLRLRYVIRRARALLATAVDAPQIWLFPKSARPGRIRAFLHGAVDAARRRWG